MEITHLCPPEGSGVMPCCGRSPFEVPETDRMTGEFNPDYAVHPGEVISELLDEIGMKQVHLAGACGVSAKHMNQVANAVKPLHATLAVAIEFATGRRIANVLMRMQADFDVHQAREDARSKAEAMSAFLADAYRKVDEYDATHPEASP